VSLEDFNRKMEKLIRDCHTTLKQNGHVALLIQNSTELGREIAKTRRYYAEHVFDCYEFFIKAGFTPLQRINVPLTCLEKLDIPEDLVRKGKAQGIIFKDGARVPVEITNKDSGERYTSRLAVTSNGELYIPVEIQNLIKNAESVRVSLL